MDGATLTRAIQDLARIDDAGLLADLLADIAAERRGWPRSDLQRFPLRAPLVKRMARHAADLFALPLADCEAAAIVALLPDCRERQVLDTIARYKTRVAVEPSAEPSAPATVPLTIAAASASDDAALARARKRLTEPKVHREPLDDAALARARKRRRA